MRKLILLVVLLVGLTSIMAIRGQETPDLPAPTPPFVASVPENADWTITVKYPPQPSPAPGTPKYHDWRFVEVRSTKQGKLKRDLLTSREGIKNEHWFMESMMLWTTAEGEVSINDMRGAEAADPNDDSPTVATGFPGVKWLQLSYYKDVVFIEKRPAYHYASESMEAWIDVETRLPLAYKRSNISYRYKFNPPPNAPLIMPPAYQNAWDTLLKMRKRRNKPGV